MCPPLPRPDFHVITTLQIPICFNLSKYHKPFYKMFMCFCVVLNTVIIFFKAKLPVDGIGFYAYMSTDEPDPRGHHTLVYDIIQTNLGQGYNKNTGVFTVPKTGLYSFSWSTRVECHLAHTTELVINDRILGSTYAYCGYNTVTGHVVATVFQGDVIFVRTHSTSPGQGAIKSNEFGRSAFSGFLIH